MHEFQSLPYYSRDSIDHIIGLFRILVDYIVDKELLSLESGLVVDRISKYIEQNIGRPVLIEEAASLVQKSSSGLTRLVKQYTGKSFKQFYIEKKIEYAKKLFQDEPGATVAEIAERVGYRDPFYFSRIFSKYCGTSPREYRTQAPLR
jgi:two-component system response regulator YesN